MSNRPISCPLHSDTNTKFDFFKVIELLKRLCREKENNLATWPRHLTLWLINFPCASAHPGHKKTSSTTVSRTSFIKCRLWDLVAASFNCFMNCLLQLLNVSSHQRYSAFLLSLSCQYANARPLLGLMGTKQGLHPGLEYFCAHGVEYRVDRRIDGQNYDSHPGVRLQYKYETVALKISNTLQKSI